MKGKWKVSHNYAGGEMLIQVYRQLDVTEPDHAGNREYKPGFFETDEEAQALADSLNTKHWKTSYSMMYRNGSVQEARRCRMADLISRQAAIDALHMDLIYRMGTDSNKKRLDDWINSLPSAQGKPFNLPEIYIADGYDTIEGEDGNVGFGVYVPDENQIYVAGDVEGEIRARALLHEICHWVQAMCGRSFDEDEANEFSDIVYDALPSAQETHEERTETHACDLISRQAAIDALDEQIALCNKALGSFDISMKDEYAVKVERASLKAYRETLNVLPSA